MMDDGGHYIAARFNGPTDTFNHFAQGANFNRGGYRVLESGWANDIKAGKQVYVSITPTYGSSSKRPSAIKSHFRSTVRSRSGFSRTARKANRMANEMGPMLNAIGKILARDTAYPLDGTFLYVEAEWQMVGMALFKDLGDHLLYREPMDDLADALLELWEAAPEDKRWSTMQYRIEGDRFDAAFTYEPLDPKISAFDRQQHILRQRFGNKQVVYPPLK